MSPTSRSESADSKVLKQARNACYKARDDFFQCVADAGVTFSLDTPIPSQCRRLRQEFERSCKPSWVKHFDVSHDKELKVLQTLRQNINKAATTSTGNLSGQDQRPN